MVCLDTLGQDRGFTDDERRFVLTTVQRFKKFWEDSEVRALNNDCNRKIQIIKRDPTDGVEQL